LITTRNYTHQYNGIGWEANDGEYPASEAGCGWIPSTKTRIFKNTPQIRFEYPVHELVDPALERNGYIIRQCHAPVHHYGFLDLRNVDQKGKHYHTIGKKKLNKMKDDPKAIHELAVQANLIGDQKGAIKLWNKLAKLLPHSAKVHVNLSSVYGKLGDYKKSKSAALKAIEAAPKTKEGQLNLGRSEFFLGNFSEALKVFAKLVRLEKDYYSAVFMLGASQICCGDAERGLATVQKLKPLSIWSSLPHAFKELAGLLTRAGFDANARDLVRCASRLSIIHGGEPNQMAFVEDNHPVSHVDVPMAS
jgi:tetratricopeptide (TPR) repeat protein